MEAALDIVGSTCMTDRFHFDIDIRHLWFRFFVDHIARFAVAAAVAAVVIAAVFVVVRPRY